MNISAAAAVVVATLSVSTGAIYWQVQQDTVLDDYKETRNDIWLLQCIQQCQNTCRVNDVPLQFCKCPQCEVHRQSRGDS